MNAIQVRFRTAYHNWVSYTCSLYIGVPNTPLGFLLPYTCERFMCVCLPHKVKQCCTRRAALFVIYVITGSLMMLNIHLLYGFGNLTLTINHNETKVSDCVLAAEDVYIFLIYAWDWIDLCMFCLIPFWCCYLDMFPYLCNTNVLKCCKPCSVLP